MSYLNEEREGELPQWNGWIQATSITAIIRFIVPVQGHKQRGLVVVPDHHGDVDVRVVAVVDAAEVEVTVQVAGVRGHLQVLFVEVQGTQAQDHGLQNALRTWQQTMAVLSCRSCSSVT